MNKTTHDGGAAAILSEYQDYAYRISHDLNAPLRAIVEFSKILAQEHADKLDADAKEYLGLIVASGQKMQAMMEGLLQYSRINTLEKHFSPVDVGQVITDVLLITEEPIKKLGSELIIKDLPTLYADKEQIILLFKVLIDNAIKFQPSGHKPLVTISAEKKDNYWQFSVSDNGIGIQQQFQNKVFQLFAQLHSNNQYPGVGVGLTLAQKIVSHHGGSIWFESSMGKGSIFYFTLPLEQNLNTLGELL